MPKSRGMLVAATLAAVATLAGAAGQAADESAAAQAANPGRLQAFGSCGELLSYVKQHAEPLVGPWGFSRPVVGISPVAAAPAAPSARAGGAQTPEYSTTNVQEAGVDEPDMVKSNGAHIFTVTSGKLHAVDVRGREPRLVGSLKLESGWEHELLLRGKRLLVLSKTGPWAIPLPGAARTVAHYPNSKSVVAEVDVSNPAAMRIVRTLELEGVYRTARLAGGTARIIAASSIPDAINW